MRVLLILIFICLSSSTRATSFNDPIVDAAEVGDAEQVTRLIKQGVQPDSKGDFGTTALMRAALHGNNDIIKILMESGAYANAADIGGETALHLAAKNGHIESVKSLIYYGAYIDVPDKEKWTPLMRATLAKQPDVVKVLLDKGADINALNTTKESVLVHAAIAGVPEIAAMITGSPKANTIPPEQQTRAVSIAKRKKYDNVEKIISDFAENKDKASTIPSVATIDSPAIPAAIDEEKTSTAKTDNKLLGKLPAKIDTESDAATKLPTEKVETAGAPNHPAVKEIIYEPAGIFFIQLGNYNDTVGAEAAWDKIYSANKDILSKLSPKIIKSTNPSGKANDAVYRLRAGTLSTRKEADSACMSIRAKNLECYVVEITNFADEKDLPAKTADSNPVKPAEDYLAPISKTPSPALPLTAFSGSYPKLADTAMPGSVPFANNAGPIDIEEAAVQGSLPATPPTQPTTPLPEKAPGSLNIEYSYPNSHPDKKLYPTLADKTPPETSAPPAEIVPVPAKMPEDNSEFIENKEQARNEVQEMTKENFFRKQGIKPPQRPKKEYDDFYKQIENNQATDAPVSEAILVPDETYFSGSNNNFAKSSGDSWINISNLPSEEFANDYGVRMFKRDESLGNVQVIVMKPGANTQAVSMRVGPLQPGHASLLCNNVIAGGFSCSASGGSAAQAAAETTPSAEINNTNRAVSQSPDNPFVSTIEEKPAEFWINLGTFASNSEAEYYWMFIKEDNGDILNAMKYNLAATKGSADFSDGAIELRTGPFPAKQYASQLCNIMRYRNIACLVE